MAAAAVAALLIASVVLAVPSILILIAAVVALFSHANTMSTAAASHTPAGHQKSASVQEHVAKADQSAGVAGGQVEGKEEWKGSEKRGEKRDEPSAKGSKQYSGEQRSSAGGQRGSESPAPEPYTVSQLTPHISLIARLPRLSLRCVFVHGFLCHVRAGVTQAQHTGVATEKEATQTEPKSESKKEETPLGQRRTALASKPTEHVSDISRPVCQPPLTPHPPTVSLLLLCV